MIEYAATAEVKQGMARAHKRVRRSCVMRSWIFARRRASASGYRVSRWASARAS